jgi:hypothetical protein
MTNKYILLPIASLVFIVFLFGCGSSRNIENPFSSPKPVRTWNGTWNSSKVTSSGTIFITLTQSETTFSGSMTMTGSSCFSTATITSWTVDGNTINWSSPEIGNFTGTISGASIAGTYSVTSTGACFGDTGTFAVTST